MNTFSNAYLSAGSPKSEVPKIPVPADTVDKARHQNHRNPNIAKGITFFEEKKK
jgi:hypothetical protein